MIDDSDQLLPTPKFPETTRGICLLTNDSHLVYRTEDFPLTVSSKSTETVFLHGVVGKDHTLNLTAWSRIPFISNADATST